MNGVDRGAPAPGPYETCDHARADSQHVFDETARHYRTDGAGVIERINLGLLQAAYATAGVDLGEYDLAVLGFLAEALPEEVQVLIGLVERTRAAARSVLGREIETLRAQVDSLETKVRRTAPGSPAPTLLPEGARVSTRLGIGTVIDPARAVEPAVVVELDIVLRNTAVRTVLVPVGNLTRLNGTHTADRSANQ